MPMFNVLVTVDCTMSCQINVEADSAGAAESLALNVVTHEPHMAMWENDDGFASDPYIADPGNCAEEVK